jgi:hypothetical protein
MERITIEDYRNNIFRKKIKGSYLNQDNKKFIFRYTELGMFTKKRFLFVNEKIVIQCSGKNGMYFCEGKWLPVFLRKKAFRGFYLCIYSQTKDEKCIEGLKIGKPSPDGFSDMILVSQKNTIFHCLLQKTKFVECYSNIYPEDIIIKESYISNLMDLSIFFLGCSTSFNPDVFVGVE